MPREIKAALRRHDAPLADEIGKFVVERIAKESATFRTINDALIARIAVLEAERRAVPDTETAAVLDLVAERQRRSGTA